jgi:hypothetical protein
MVLDFLDEWREDDYFGDAERAILNASDDNLSQRQAEFDQLRARYVSVHGYDPYDDD